MEPKHSLRVGHNKKTFPCHFLWNHLISQGDFFFDHTISPVIIVQLAALICNSFYVNASDLELTFPKGQLIKWDNYTLDVQVKNLWYANVTRFHIAWHCKYFFEPASVTLLFCYFTSFTCKNTGPFEKIPTMRNTLKIFSANGNGSKHSSFNEKLVCARTTY